MNIYLFTLDHQFPKGNNSGISVVLRNYRGTIIKIYSWTTRNFTPRSLELWSMLLGLRGSFFENEDMIEFEKDSPEALKKW